MAPLSEALPSTVLPSHPSTHHRCSPQVRLFSSAAPIDFEPTDVARARNADPDAMFVVTGGNRGIGLEFVAQLLERTQGSVVAGCRSPAAATDLHALAETSNGRLEVAQLDVGDQASVEAFAASVAEKHQRCDMLLNVAGILHDEAHPAAPERALKSVDREWFSKTLEVNTVGPLMLAQALEPLLRSTGRGAAKTASGETRPPSVVANLSARVGSIGDNGMGGWYSYRISKAALNMATKNMSLELKRRCAAPRRAAPRHATPRHAMPRHAMPRHATHAMLRHATNSGVWCVSLHPGTTDTGLSKPFQKNVKPEKLFTTKFTVSQVL